MSLGKGIDALGEYLEKAHYTKREGTPGNYKYTYPDSAGPGFIQNEPEARYNERKQAHDNSKGAAEDKASAPASKYLHEEAHPHGKYHVEDHGASVHAVMFTPKRGKKAQTLANPSSLEGAKKFITRHASEQGKPAFKPEPGKQYRLTGPGSIASGNPKPVDTPKEQTEKSMKGLAGLDAFLKSEAGALPTGEAGLESNAANGIADGLAGLGKQSGNGSSSAGPAIGAPSVSEEKLSEDDDTVETQLGGGEPKTLAKGQRNYTRHELEHSVARERAMTERRLRKGEGDGEVHVPARAQRPAAIIEKSVNRWSQGPESLVSYNDSIDQQAEALLKSDDMYRGPSPSMSARRDVTLCKSCDSTFSLSLTSCPSCGEGCVGHQLIKGMAPATIVEDSRTGPGLRRARSEGDLLLPHGVVSEE